MEEQCSIEQILPDVSVSHSLNFTLKGSSRDVGVVKTHVCTFFGGRVSCGSAWLVSRESQFQGGNWSRRCHAGSLRERESLDVLMEAQRCILSNPVCEDTSQPPNPNIVWTG